MRPRALAMLALVAPLVCALEGCSGYRWLRYGGALGEVRSIAIQPLSNHSYEAGAEALVNDALLREFQRRGSVQLVKDPEHADVVLSGSLLPLTTRARSFSSVAFALEYEVQMSLDLSARRTSGNVIRFGPGVLRGTEIYLASSDIEVQRKNREEAIRRICAVLAERVHDALAEKLIADAAAPAASPTPAKPAAPAPAP